MGNIVWRVSGYDGRNERFVEEYATEAEASAAINDRWDRWKESATVERVDKDKEPPIEVWRLSWTNKNNGLKGESFYSLKTDAERQCDLMSTFHWATNIAVHVYELKR